MRKTYSLNVEDNKIISVEVNGVLYENADEITDPLDRLWVSSLLSASPDPMPLAPAITPFPFERYLFLVFLAVAAVMLGIAALTGVFAYQRLQNERTAEGRVTDLISRKDSEGNEFFYPQVQFALPTGERKTVQLSEGSWPAAHERGDKVTVRYNAAKPNDARIESFSSGLGLWIWTIISGILGLAFTAATLLAASMLKPSSPPDKETLS